MKKRRISALAAIFIVISLAFTCTACSLKYGADNSDNSSETIDREVDAGQDGLGASGDPSSAVFEVADAESGVDQGNLLPDTGLSIETLENEGFELFLDRSYDIELENYGQVTFVTGSVEVAGLSKLKIYLIDGNGNVLYEFPDFYGNDWSMLCDVTDIAFNDLNRDGLKDVIVIANYMTGVGPTGAEEFPVAGVYFQSDREFVSIPWLDDEFNMKETDISIDGVVDYVDKFDPEMLAPYISNKNGSTGNAASLESWAGDYTYTEYAPPDQNMFYSITIYIKNTACYADIYIDGFQTMKRLRAKVIENGSSIDLLFDSYLPDNLMDIYEEGDHLFSLEKSGSKLLTKWAKIEPMLSDNNVRSGEFFEKVE